MARVTDRIDRGRQRMVNKKRVYEPPMGRDLSCIRANGGLLTGEGGGTTLGMCMNGTSVTSANCADGPWVTGTASCAPNGFNPTVTSCAIGNGGLSGCYSGTYVGG